MTTINHKFLTYRTTTAVKLHSHRYVLMPSCWSKTDLDVTSPDWRNQVMRQNSGDHTRLVMGGRGFKSRSGQTFFQTFTLEIYIYIYLTNRFHVAVRLFSNRSQMTSKCGKNKKVAHEAQPSVSLMLLIINLFANSCDHIFTNGKAPLHSHINHNNPQFLYSL